MNRTEEGRDAHLAQGLSVQVERVCLLCPVLSKLPVTSIIDPPSRGPMRVAYSSTVEQQYYRNSSSLDNFPTFVWMVLSEYGSTGYDCQFCSRSAERGE